MANNCEHNCPYFKDTAIQERCPNKANKGLTQAEAVETCSRIVAQTIDRRIVPGGNPKTWEIPGVITPGLERHYPKIGVPNDPELHPGI